MSENNRNKDQDLLSDKAINKNLPIFILYVISILALLCSTAAIVILFNVTRNEVHPALSKLSSALVRYDQDLNKIQSDFNSQKNAVQAMGVEVDNVKALVATQQSHLSNITQSGVINVNLALAEINYLVKMANYHVTIEANPLIASQLLQMADDKLSKLSDPNFISLRQNIAKRILALQAVPKVDIGSISIKLNALQDEVATLPIQMPNTALPTLSTTDPINSNKLGWKDKLYLSVKSFEGLVVIRRHDKPIEPILSPEQQIYLTQNIQLLLQESQWAMLHRQQDIYQADLSNVVQLVSNHYQVSNTMVVNFISNIKALMEINIAPKLPSLADLLEQLRPYDKSNSI